MPVRGGASRLLIRSMALVGVVVSGLAGCKDPVSLGEFATNNEAGEGGAPGTGGGAGMDGGAGVPPLPECGETGEVDVVSQGAGLGVTITYTDWTFEETFDSLEWEFRIEVEPMADGYVWAQEFTLESGNIGLVALQANGGYQADPPAGMTEITKMVQFWIGGPPLRAELADIPYPDARTSLEMQRGTEWWTINARYDWQLCRAYRFRVSREEMAPGGGRWYAARVRDTVTGAETLIGRILTPEAWGRLGTPVRNWSNRIGWGPVLTCDGPEAAAALFSVPRANDGAIEPTSRTNRFAMPQLCPSSRITNLPGGVRHEVGRLAP